MSFDDRPEPAKRLEQARIRRGFATPRAACDFFGWSYDTYVQHENGTRGLARSAARYATAYRVKAGWLLTGDGDAASRNVLNVVGYIGAGARIDPIDGDGGDDMLDEVEVDFPIRQGTAAAIVRGDSMLPVFEDGDLIGYYRDGQDPLANVGKTCVVKLVNGPIYIKKLRKGSEPGLYTLTSHNASDIEDVELEWVAPFKFRLPRDDWRRI